MVSGDCPIAGEAVLFGYTIVDLDTVPLGPAQELLTPLSAYADKGANDLLVQMARAIKYGPDLLPVSFGDSWK